VGDGTGTREASKRATRQALLDAAIAEFTERGFDTPSLDAICARAGFTRGAFYVHFHDRDELVAAAMEQSLHAFLDGIIDRGSVTDDIGATVGRFIEVALQPMILGEAAQEPSGVAGPVLHQLLEACDRSESVRAAFVQMLTEAVGRVTPAARGGQGIGQLRSDVGAEEISTLLVLLALGAWTAGELKLPLDLPRLSDALLRLLQRG
jgi:TetR/AcrR family transcriptional repressor of nem operon